jgi:release factor glutamine methyltransferase
MPAEPGRAELRQPCETLLRNASRRIPRLDAEALLAHLVGMPRLEMLARPGLAADARAYAALVARREAGEPLAYITGRREFWSLDLIVSPDVLIPRPDSETLITAALAGLREAPPKRMLDLGTGSGALLLAALSEFSSAFGIGADRSFPALAIAAANAARLGFGGRAAFLQADWGQPLAGSFDLILCNPPYIAEDEALMPEVALHEPEAALRAGADGLAAFPQVIREMARLLAPDGLGVLEIGVGQSAAVEGLAGADGFAVEWHEDLAGRPRAGALRRQTGGLGKPQQPG